MLHYDVIPGSMFFMAGGGGDGGVRTRYSGRVVLRWRSTHPSTIAKRMRRKGCGIVIRLFGTSSHDGRLASKEIIKDRSQHGGHREKAIILTD